MITKAVSFISLCFSIRLLNIFHRFVRTEVTDICSQTKSFWMAIWAVCWPLTSCAIKYKPCDSLFTMLFHSPLASSSCPFMVKWKQSWVKKVISIFPFCTERQRHTHEHGLTEGGVLGKAAAVTLGMLMILCNVSHWFISCHVDIVEAFGVRLDYRETGRVCVLQEGLENNSKVVPEEPVAVQQLLKSFLWTLGTWKSIYLPVSWFITIGVIA